MQLPLFVRKGEQLDAVYPTAVPCLVDSFQEIYHIRVSFSKCSVDTTSSPVCPQTLLRDKIDSPLTRWQGNHHMPED